MVDERSGVATLATSGGAKRGMRRDMPLVYRQHLFCGK